MSKYSKKFSDEMDELFPGWRRYSSGMLCRFMDDNIQSGIPYQQILDAKSLDALKAKALRIKKMHDLYHELTTGACYQDQMEARKEVGCPRIYAQCADDQAAVDAFTCYGVSYIPSCPKFASGECWKKFDDLGFSMK